MTRSIYKFAHQQLWRGVATQSRQSAKLFLQSAHSEGHTRWLERGWESPNSDEGTYNVVLIKYTYFVGGELMQLSTRIC